MLARSRRSPNPAGRRTCQAIWKSYSLSGSPSMTACISFHAAAGTRGIFSDSWDRNCRGICIFRSNGNIIYGHMLASTGGRSLQSNKENRCKCAIGFFHSFSPGERFRLSGGRSREVTAGENLFYHKNFTAGPVHTRPPGPVVRPFRQGLRPPSAPCSQRAAGERKRRFLQPRHGC